MQTKKQKPSKQTIPETQFFCKGTLKNPRLFFFPKSDH